MRARPSRAIGTNIKAGLITVLFMLLLVVPGIIKGLSFALTTPALYRELRADPLETSTRLAHGHRWPLLGLLAIVFSGLIVVGMVVGVPLAALSELIPSAAPMLSILSDIGVRLAELLMVSTLVAAYYGLKRTKEEALPHLET